MNWWSAGEGRSDDECIEGERIKEGAVREEAATGWKRDCRARVCVCV